MSKKSNSATKRELAQAQTELLMAKADFWNSLAAVVSSYKKDEIDGESVTDAEDGDEGLAGLVGRLLRRHGVDGDE
jgi:hypothetical protein